MQALLGTASTGAVSEFRQDYLRKETIPSHPLATYASNKSDTAILSEGDGD